MRPSFFTKVLCIVCCASAGCAKNNPTSPSGSGGSPSVTIPRPVAPSATVQIHNADQPITLVVANATISQGSATTYTFEVASDPGFGATVYSKSGVASGGSGQTSLTIDKLRGGADYFWHARAESGGTVGPFSAAQKLTIGPEITIGPPSPRIPAAGAAAGSLQPMTVANAAHTGPAGPLGYTFEVATNPGFAPVALTRTVAEGSGTTTLQPDVELPPETTVYWRVRVSDPANGVTGPASDTASFVTSLAIDLTKAVFLHSPNVSNWPRTATLTLVEQDGGGSGPVCMSYTDPGWPDTDWPFDNVNDFGVYANQWYFARINGVWYGGAGEWIYRGAGSCKAGQGTRTIGPDSGFGPPFSTWVPKVGELVGFMVSSVARNGPVRRTVDERSNIIVQPWRDTSLGSAALARSK